MDTKSEIISIAKAEFMEVGFQEASMRKIASKVGITATALYRHYANKEEIFDAIVEPAVSSWFAMCKTEEIRQTGTAGSRGLMPCGRIKSRQGLLWT